MRQPPEMSPFRSTPLKLMSLFAILAVVNGCGGTGETPSSSPAPISSGSSSTGGSSQPSSVTLSFANVTAGSGIQFVHGYVAPAGGPEENFSGGVASGDYDGDGDVDLFVVRGDLGPNQLYRNDGNNLFTDVAAAAGVAFTKAGSDNHRLSGPTFADMDGDGDLDLFIGGFAGDPSHVYQNNGDGTFTDVTAGSGIDTITSLNTISAAFGDYDLDGDVDLFLTHWGTFRDRANPGDTEHLWRNVSSGGVIKFESVSVASGIAATIIQDAPAGMKGTDHDYTFTPTFVDINQDRYPDLLVVADFNTTQAFTNNQDGTFTNVTDDAVLVDRAGMGSAVGDYDNDGDMDWFVSSIYSLDISQELGNRLYKNNNGVFVDATDGSGVIDGSWGWGACFADFNLDGHLDIYHTNGWSDPVSTAGFSRDDSRLFISNGDGTFTERASGSGVRDSEQGRAIVCDDFDRDGDVDIFVIHRDANNSAFLFENQTMGNNYLAIDLVGAGTNTEAAGAVIAVTAGGVTQTRQITIGSNFTSHNSTMQIIGLGDNQQADRIEVTWPDGSQLVRENVLANQRLQYSQ